MFFIRLPYETFEWTALIFIDHNDAMTLYTYTSYVIRDITVNSSFVVHCYGLMEKLSSFAKIAVGLSAFRFFPNINIILSKIKCIMRNKIQIIWFIIYKGT